MVKADDDKAGIQKASDDVAGSKLIFTLYEAKSKLPNDIANRSEWERFF